MRLFIISYLESLQTNSTVLVSLPFCSPPPLLIAFLPKSHSAYSKTNRIQALTPYYHSNPSPVVPWNSSLDHNRPSDVGLIQQAYLGLSSLSLFFFLILLSLHGLKPSLGIDFLKFCLLCFLMPLLFVLLPFL